MILRFRALLDDVHASAFGNTEAMNLGRRTPEPWSRNGTLYVRYLPRYWI